MTRPSHANASEETLKRAAAGKGSSGVATLHEPATITPAPLSPAFAAPSVNKDQLNLNKAERAMEMQRERGGKRAAERSSKCNCHDNCLSRKGGVA